METGVSRKIILRVWASGTTALHFLTSTFPLSSIPYPVFSLSVTVWVPVEVATIHAFSFVLKVLAFQTLCRSCRPAPIGLIALRVAAVSCMNACRHVVVITHLVWFQQPIDHVQAERNVKLSTQLSFEQRWAPRPDSYKGWIWACVMDWFHSISITSEKNIECQLRQSLLKITSNKTQAKRPSNHAFYNLYKEHDNFHWERTWSLNKCTFERTTRWLADNVFQLKRRHGARRVAQKCAPCDVIAESCVTTDDHAAIIDEFQRLQRERGQLCISRYVHRKLSLEVRTEHAVDALHWSQERQVGERCVNDSEVAINLLQWWQTLKVIHCKWLYSKCWVPNGYMGGKIANHEY